MDKRNIEIRLKNIFERYENIASSKAPFSFELEIMYADALSFTPIVTRGETQSRDLNYLKSRISEAMKSTDIQAFRMRKVNGRNAKAQADTWEEFMLRENKPAQVPNPPPPVQGFGGVGRLEFEGKPFTPEGLAGIIDAKLGSMKQEFERESMRKAFELEKIQEQTKLEQKVFMLEFQKNADAEKIKQLEKQIQALEDENQELEDEIDELEEIAGEIEELRKKSSSGKKVVQVAGIGLSKLIEKHNPAIAQELGSLFGIADDEEQEADTQTQAPAPPPPPMAGTDPEPEPSDKKSQSIKQLVDWLKKLDNNTFIDVFNINSAMYNDASKIKTLIELLKS